MNRSVKNYLKPFIYAVISSLTLIMNYNEVLPKYNFTFYIIFAALFFCFIKLNEFNFHEKSNFYTLSILTSVALLIGQSYRLDDTWNQAFGSFVNIFLFIFCTVGYTFIFSYLYRLLFYMFEKLEIKSAINIPFADKFFQKDKLLPIAGIILLCWLPIIILCFPGGSCIDVSYQIEQAIGNIPFTTLHPITHTLYMGMFLNPSKAIFGSYYAGFYLSILVQCFLVALCQASSLRNARRLGVKDTYLLFVLALYCFTPLYSNLATTALKDTLYCSWCLLYVVMLSNVCIETCNGIFSVKTCLKCAFAALLVTLFRNNGIYVVALTGCALLFWFIGKKTTIKKARISCIVLVALLPVLMFKTTDASLTKIFKAETFSNKEFLSLPFQMTGRYIRDYGFDMSTEEKAAISAVLNDVDELGSIYETYASDPMKRQYREEASNADVKAYLGAWVKCGFRHPDVYIQATLNQTYGWFDIGLRNSLRHEGRLDIVSFGVMSTKMDHLLNYLYNFLNRVPFLGLLENTALYVWVMFLLIVYIFKKNKTELWILFIPLLVSLLVCVASPCFIDNPRYAYPIVFSMPYLCGIVTSYKKELGE